MTFKKGDRVRAKWPGSNKYFLGTVLETGDGKCKVKFDEGTSYSVLIKHIYKEYPGSPSKGSSNSTSDHSPSRKSSVERSARKSSTERTTRRSSTERTSRKSSTERSLRKSSTERSLRKPSTERSVRKPSAERSPSRTVSRAQHSPSRSGRETPKSFRSPGRPKGSNLRTNLTEVSSETNVRKTFTQPSAELSMEMGRETKSPFIVAITRLEDQKKELSEKLTSPPSRSESSYEFSSVKTSFLSQVSARRSLRAAAVPAPVPSRSTPVPVTSTPVPSRPVLNGSFSDDDLSGDDERVVTRSVVKELAEEMVEGRPAAEPSDVPSAMDLLHSIRESSVLRSSLPPEERPRQWSLDPAARSSASLRGSVRRSVVREVDSNAVQGSVGGSRDYVELLKREGRLLALVPHDYMEWGGRVGCALLVLLVPLAVLALHLHCDKESCSASWRALNVPLTWRFYLDPVAAAAVLGFVGVQAALCVLPVGYQVDLIPNTWGSPKYRCNAGLLSAAISVAGVCAVKYLGYSLSAVSTRYFQLLVASLLFSVVLSVALYVRGGHAKLHSANPYVRHRGFIYTFWAGWEVYPQFWNLHVKALLSKISLVGSLVLSLVLLLEEVDWARGQCPTTLLVCTAMLWLCLLDGLWFEEAALTSFSMLYEGCGYMAATLGCLRPFLATLPLRYHLLHRQELSYYALALLSVVFLAGFLLYRLSNSQKDKFRRNPLDPAIAHLETIQTSVPRARKLLVSSYWGFVRHPNYLGDLVMHFAMAGTCGLTLALPYAVPLCLLAVLLHRASRDGARCAHRYGSDWNRYCSVVKYKVIPYVY
ncbi:delta(14)-sterol reductase LBR-like isoform X2 [Bacillus rossius redtenbacheri]|uniref:delta(14)-sterol reductase LBR-like isoform X2 n=1 Tax=Bacillus rossius redtenbacheri TaxID=93214 RepID=UPI002FDE3767